MPADAKSERLVFYRAYTAFKRYETLLAEGSPESTQAAYEALYEALFTDDKAADLPPKLRAKAVKYAKKMTTSTDVDVRLRTRSLAPGSSVCRHRGG